MEDSSNYCRGSSGIKSFKENLKKEIDFQIGSGECQNIEVDVVAVESEIRSVEFGWKIDFLFVVLGGSVIPGHCGEKTFSDLRLIVCKWTKHPPCHRLAHIWVRCN